MHYVVLVYYSGRRGGSKQPEEKKRFDHRQGEQTEILFTGALLSQWLAIAFIFILKIYIISSSCCCLGSLML